MDLFRAVARWWNRHRTGEKTAAVLAFMAIVLGAYFGLHSMRQEGAGNSPPAAGTTSQPSAPDVSVSACPAAAQTLRSQAQAIACEVVAYCTAREAHAPSSDDPSYQHYEEQSGREAARRYYPTLVSVVSKLNAAGLHNAQTNVTAADASDQDCDTLSTAAAGVTQLANRLPAR